MAGSNSPTQWDHSERGESPARPASLASGDRSADDDWVSDSVFEGAEQFSSHGSGGPMLRPRRSSLSRQLGAVVDIGGPNSIRSFSRSWARAANFQEVIPSRPALVMQSDDSSMAQVFNFDHSPVLGSSPATSLFGQSFLQQAGQMPLAPGSGRATPTTSLRRGRNAALLSAHETQPLLVGASATSAPIDYRNRERKQLERLLGVGEGGHTRRTGSQEYLAPAEAVSPRAVSPSGISCGSWQTYGTTDSVQSNRSMVEAGPTWRKRQHDVEADPADHDGGSSVLVHQVEQDGKRVLTVKGQSTLPQTVFNSINVLIGVGLLALPLGIRYSGWIPGILTLCLAALVTKYTAGLLAKCMALDATLVTFSDIAYLSFGSRARLATGVLFTVELAAAGVAMIVLFADSLELLFPGLLKPDEWKAACAIALIPLNFMPLRLLSYTSVLGIISCSAIVIIVIIDGLSKPIGPGSLIDPAMTYLWPKNWLRLPFSFGLLMAPWGGHAVFPNIYRDMRHPQRYGRALDFTYLFTFGIDLLMAIVGILMFGDDVQNEITSSILSTSGYPEVLRFMLCMFVAIIPITKIPLTTRPILSTIEVMADLHTTSTSADQGLGEESPTLMWWKGVARACIRVGINILLLMLAILVPGFDNIMAFMGSAMCFTICVLLPIAFYLTLLGHQISTQERIFCYFLFAVTSLLCVTGTVWAFLPKSLLDS